MDKLNILRMGVSKLPAKDQEFAKSLLRQFDSKHSLSDKQWYWVERLADSLSQPEKSPEEPPVVEIGDFHKVIELFKKARQHLKYPKITLQVGAQPIALSVAGENSRAPGTVNVTDGKPFGQNVWFGRVTPDGQWQVSLRAPEDSLGTVEEFLLKFAANPAQTAKEYGRLTGRCCFCSLPLTDVHSTSAGFGRTCAKNYGLEAEWKNAQPLLKEAA